MTAGRERIVMFGSIKEVTPASQNQYYSIQLIDKKYILCGMHLPSQIYANHQYRHPRKDISDHLPVIFEIKEG